MTITTKSTNYFYKTYLLAGINHHMTSLVHTWARCVNVSLTKRLTSKIDNVSKHFHVTRELLVIFNQFYSYFPVQLSG